MANPFTPQFEKLPATLPIFPLPNAVVMPGAQLPLNIFEPRYLNMVFDALAADRMIGMVQPDPTSPDAHGEGVYKTGTAGRITSFSETNGGRLFIVLTGVCRFDIREELATTRGYRRIVANWARFRTDYDLDPSISIDRNRLLSLLKAYLNAQRVDTDWKSLEHLRTLPLVNLLTGQLPLEVAERQSLIETVSASERARLLLGLLDVATVQPVPTPKRPH